MTILKTVKHSWKNSLQIPSITLRGEKLRKLGFEIGSCVAIETREGEITITPCSEEVIKQMKEQDIKGKINN